MTSEPSVPSKNMRALTNIEQLKQWAADYKSHLTISPLEDIGQLAAQLDVTHAHPSGIAQLFASGQAPLDSLFRDSGMLRASSRRLDRVREDRDAKSRVTGVAELSMIVGVATWGRNAVPVLLYPVEAPRVRDRQGVEQSVIRFTGHVRLNPSFVHMMSSNGVAFNEQDLFDGRNYESGTPETSAVFRAIADRARTALEDFRIDRRIIVGCFMDPASQVLLEAQTLIAAMSQGQCANELLLALAGDATASARVRGPQLEPYSPFDNNPHVEVEVGDVDNTVRYAAQLAANGRNVSIDVANNAQSTAVAAAIASRAIMQGKTVLYAPSVPAQKQRFMRVMKSHQLLSHVFDIADPSFEERVDKQLIEAVSSQPSAAGERFEQVADELVGVRSRLTRYLGDLHGVHEQWGVSGYQTIQQLANIASLPTHPSTHVRLSVDVAHRIADSLDQWSATLREAGELGEYDIDASSTPWYHADIDNEEQATTTYGRIADMLSRVLPSTREQVVSTTQTCGFPAPKTAQEWSMQVRVLKNLRRVLDVFQPDVFERDIDALIEASKPKHIRKAEGSKMGFWERRRLVKEAKGLLRPGAQVESLYEALQVVSKQSEQWRVFVPHGGWPVLPSKLDQIIETQETLIAHLTALDSVLATTVKGGNTASLEFVVLEERLRALYDDHDALATLPRRTQLERALHEAGLDQLVEDLHARHVDNDAVDAELRLAWWTTVFETIVQSSSMIAHQDGMALQSAADRFIQVDAEHLATIGAMVHEEATRKLREVLFARPQEANRLHTLIAGGSRTSIATILRDYAAITKHAVPVLVATPPSAATMSDSAPLVDIAIVDACAHMPAIQLLTILARARQVVLIAHHATISSPSVRTMSKILRSVSVPEHLNVRSRNVSQFLVEHGYGAISSAPVIQAVRGQAHFHFIEATGVPVISTGLVESSQQEIAAVIDIIMQRAAGFTVVPAQYMLTVITLTTTFRTRLGSELKALAAHNESMARFLRHVRLIGLDEVAGAQATDVILSLCYAKTAHGRLLHQFAQLERDHSAGMLLDALALAERNLDIVSAFNADDLEDDRLHQSGEILLKQLLSWAEQLQVSQDKPQEHDTSINILFNDLADRIRARGLKVALDYGFSDGITIPLVVGIEGKPFNLAILTDNGTFMEQASTRMRHRVLTQDLQAMGWSVMNVWSVSAFVNPDKEVDRVVAKIGELYKEVR